MDSSAETRKADRVPSPSKEVCLAYAAIEQGSYTTLDAADTLSTFMVDDTLDAGRFMETCDNLIATAAKAATGERPRVTVFEEGTQLL